MRAYVPDTPFGTYVRTQVHAAHAYSDKASNAKKNRAREERRAVGRSKARGRCRGRKAPTAACWVAKKKGVVRSEEKRSSRRSALVCVREREREREKGTRRDSEEDGTNTVHRVREGEREKTIG